MKIGIPRALHYYKQPVFFTELLKELGFDIVLSPETNQELLNRGVNFAIDESCLSIKIYLGHVEWLLNRCDYIFIPRLVSVKNGESFCTKFMALGDIVRNTFPQAKIIEYSVDKGRFRFELLEILKAFTKLNRSIPEIIAAYFVARRKEREFFAKEYKEQSELLNKTKTGPRILIVSHPYTIYDKYLGRPIINFLESQGVELLFADRADHKEAQKLSKNISKELYWTANKELLGAIEMYKDKIDGIIFLMVFPCGPDALVVNLCQNKIKDVPLVVITLDELQAEAGLKTRLESFVDILKFKETWKK